MRKIRILLADDHQLMRSGIRLMLERETDLSVVGEANDGREAVALAKSLRPDVVVMDIGMANLNGIEAAQQMTGDSPEIAVVMLSMHSDESYVLRALKAGARGYLLKDSAEADLIKAVHAVAGGKSFFSPAVSKVLLDDYVRKLRRSGTEDAYDLLTPREREVLQLIAEGKSNKLIADALKMSESTVKAHVKQIIKRLNVVNRTQAALLAIRTTGGH